MKKICLHKFAEADDYSKYQKCKLCGKYFRPNKVRTAIGSVLGIFVLFVSSYFLNELTESWNVLLGLFFSLGCLGLMGYILTRVLPVVLHIYQEKK